MTLHQRLIDHSQDRDEQALRSFAATLVRIARRLAANPERAIIAGQRKERPNDANR